MAADFVLTGGDLTRNVVQRRLQETCQVSETIELTLKAFLESDKDTLCSMTKFAHLIGYQNKNSKQTQTILLLVFPTQLDELVHLRVKNFGTRESVLTFTFKH